MGVADVSITTQQTSIYNALVPPEGPKSVSVSLRFDLAQSLVVDFTLANAQKTISVVQCVWIDNFASGQAVTLTMEGTGQTIEVPANSQGSFPIIAAIRTKITCASTGGQAVQALFLNVPLPSAVWYKGGSSVATVVQGTSPWVVADAAAEAALAAIQASLAPLGALKVLAAVSLASNNLTTVKAGAAIFYGAHCESVAGAAAAYLKFYNGAPTMGTTPCVDQIAIPAASVTSGSGHELQVPSGVAYPSGLYMALTGGIALADNTAVAASSYNFSVEYV